RAARTSSADAPAQPARGTCWGEGVRRRNVWAVSTHRTKRRRQRRDMKLIVNSDQSLQDAIGELRQQYGAKRYVSVQITAGKSRTLDQNAIAHVWYSQVARELREDDESGVKAYCKLHFGVPILRGESDEFREKYDRLIKPMRYDEKLELMEWFPVTSLMTT